MVPMVMDTVPTAPIAMVATTTARGPLMPSPRLRLTPLSSTTPMDMASPMLEPMDPMDPMDPTEPMEPTPMPMVATPTARDLLRPSPRLRLTPLSSTPPPALPLLFPRWSLPQQRWCPGPLLNSTTTSTSPNDNDNK